MAKVAKRLFFDITGIGRVNSLPGGSFDPGGFKREPIIGDNGVVGYAEEPVAPTVQFKVANTPGVLAALRKMTTANVNVQDDNGESWIVREAFHVDVPKLSGGEIDCSMAGVAADPIKSGG
jgi:hypothetical protein